MADVPVPMVFLAVAAVTLAGFWAGRVFQRYRLPDALPLLAVGLLVGPLNRWASSHGFGWDGLAEALGPETLAAAAPIIAGFALVVLLFESGMQLEFGAFGRALGPAVLFTLVVYAATVLLLSAVAHWVLGMPPIVAVVFSVVLVNVDQAVSSGVLRRMRVDPDIRATYAVEMALYDMISIPLFVTLLEFASTAADGAGAAGILRGFIGLASVSIALGLLAGLLWITALRRLQGHPHSYMLTFAVMLGVYGFAEFLGGSGAFSTLIFGLLLGNRTFLLKRLWRVRVVDDEHEKVQAFHDEVAFFVRSAFFLFLGASFSIGIVDQWPTATGIPGLGFLDGTTALVAIGATLLLAAIVAGRVVGVRLLAAKHPERRQLFPVFGRGLDTAVLATVPFLATSYTSGEGYQALFGPWKPVFLNLSLVLVLLTVVASSVAVFLHERRLGPAPAERGDETAVPIPAKKGPRAGR